MLNVGIIGCGNIATKLHIPAYIKNEHTNVVAVCSSSADKLRDVCSEYNIKNYYTDVDEMFNNEKLDIVSICTPNKFHYEYTIKALDNSCNVFCEKPPAITYKQTKEMEEYAIKKNKIISYNFHNRAFANVEYLKKNISDLGFIYNSRVRALRKRGIPGWGYFTQKDIQGGGPLIDIGVHMLDLALYFMDYPKVKYVSASKYDILGKTSNVGFMGKWNKDLFTVEDSLFGFIQFENKSTITIETSFALNMKEEKYHNVELFGSRAGASLFPLEFYIEELDNIIRKEITNLEQESKHFGTINSFIDSCLGKSKPLVKAEEGSYLMAIVEALYKSSDENRPVFLSEIL